MSTKVYKAYKLKNPADLWKFIPVVRVQALKNTVEVIKEMYRNFMDNVDVESEEYKKRLADQNGDDFRARLYLVRDVLSKARMESSGSCVG